MCIYALRQLPYTIVKLGSSSSSDVASLHASLHHLQRPASDPISLLCVCH